MVSSEWLQCFLILIQAVSDVCLCFVIFEDRDWRTEPTRAFDDETITTKWLIGGWRLHTPLRLNAGRLCDRRDTSLSQEARLDVLMRPNRARLCWPPRHRWLLPLCSRLWSSCVNCVRAWANSVRPHWLHTYRTKVSTRLLYQNKAFPPILPACLTWLCELCKEFIHTCTAESAEQFRSAMVFILCVR